MSSTVFIAVQCCQCSTMQVKQKKKSSNKWNCAVCNQKQSVRRVFAQGFMAKDIRKFVQTFNMSRKSAEEQALFLETLAPTSEEDLICDQNDDEFLANRTKKRNDWTEYLGEEDLRDYTLKEQEQEQDGDDVEHKVVTELHKGMFKKPKLDKFSTGLATGASDCDNKLTFSRRNANKQIVSQERTMKDEPTIEIKSKWDNYKTAEDQRLQKPTIDKAASKWNDYITEDDDCRQLGRKRAFNFKDHNTDSWNSSILEAISNEHMVEDDIHPDFM